MSDERGSSSYSAYLELVGIRDLASRNPRQHKKLCAEFFSTVGDQVGVALDVRKKGVFFRDCCYIECDSLLRLFDVVDKIRQELLFYQLVTRCAITAGGLDVNSQANNRPNFSGFSLGDAAHSLFGIANRVKGVAVCLDDELADRESKAVGSRVIKNFYIASDFQHQFIVFSDLSLMGSRYESQLSTVLRLLKNSRLNDSSLPSFYVPFLVNWARSFALGSVKGDSDVLSLDETIIQGGFRIFHDVKGIELVYLALIDRVFSRVGDVFVITGERGENLRQYFANFEWIRRFFRKHGKTPVIPKEILSTRSRNAFVQEVSSK